MDDAISIANHIMQSLKKKADDVIVSASSSDDNQIKFVNSKIALNKSWLKESIDIFAVIDKKIVSTTLEEMSKENADIIIKKLIEFANKSPVSEEYQGIAEGNFIYKELVDGFDKKVQDLDNAVNIVEDSINTAEENKAQRVSGNFEYGSSKIYLLNSNGVEAEDKRTNLYLTLRAFTDKNASGHDTACSNVLSKFNYKQAAEFAGEIAHLAKNPVSVRAGKYDVIFAPLSFSNIINHIGESASIFSVEAGLSFLADKINKKIAPDTFSLTDSGCLENGAGSVKFDAEGVPTQETKIIENGILKTYLYNTSSAKRHNTKTTANSGLISPEAWNLVVKPGKLSQQDLFGEVKKGVYVTNTWYTRFQNHFTGDFSTIPRDGAFIIENGEIKHAIKDLRLSDNMLRMIQNISATSNNPKQVVGWETECPVHTAHGLVNGVNITKSFS